MDSKSNRPKSNQLALILSGILPGLGQFYNEDWVKGAAFFIASTLIDSLLFPENYLDLLRLKVPLTRDLAGRLLVVGVFRVWAIYDADRSVKRKNALALSDERTASSSTRDAR
ncbi:MAG TPA: hypothetical protein VFA47_08870 [Candidatus Manganitrophaceae bacterium]|nr:hypothetical protein [Candidatus Manganitrophaceae bacterium]